MSSTIPSHEPAGEDPHDVTGTAGEQDPASPQEKQAPRRRGLLGLLGAGITEAIMVAVIALLISAVVRAFIGQVFVIPTSSMASTVHVADRVVAVKYTKAQRGDIIVFRDPGGWLDGAVQKPTAARQFLQFVGLVPDTSARHLLKRLIGMPGDTVECCDSRGRLMINGKALEEPYLNEGLPAAKVPFKVVVPEGRVFVLGDNRNHSRDSRCHLNRITNDGEPQGMIAFVPIDNIVGPAKLRVAPLSRLGVLHRPEVFKDVNPTSLSVIPTKPVIEPAGVSC